MSLVKRTLDIGISAGALAALSPALAVIAAAIRFSDGGPVLYRQRRMGLDGRPFDILKFRSMVVGAEEESGPTWASRYLGGRSSAASCGRGLDDSPVSHVFAGDIRCGGPGRIGRVSSVSSRRIPSVMRRHRGAGSRRGAVPRCAGTPASRAHRVRALLHRELVLSLDIISCDDAAPGLRAELVLTAGAGLLDPRFRLSIQRKPRGCVARLASSRAHGPDYYAARGLVPDLLLAPVLFLAGSSGVAGFLGAGLGGVRFSRGRHSAHRWTPRRGRVDMRCGSSFGGPFVVSCVAEAAARERARRRSGSSTTSDRAEVQSASPRADPESGLESHGICRPGGESPATTSTSPCALGRPLGIARRLLGQRAPPRRSHASLPGSLRTLRPAPRRAGGLPRLTPRSTA